MRPRALIFDMDGTLFDSRTAIVPACVHAFRALADETGDGGPFPGEAEVLAHIGEPALEFYANITPPRLRARVDRVAELVRAEEKRIIRSGVTRLFPAVAETLRQLKDAGLLLAYYSNSGPGYFYTVLEAHGILALASAAACHGESRATKPELVRDLLGKLQVPPEALAVVGDRGHDIEAARANGAVAIGALYGFGSPGELDTADHLLKTFADLPAVVDGTSASRQ